MFASGRASRREINNMDQCERVLFIGTQFSNLYTAVDTSQMRNNSSDREYGTCEP